MTAVIYEQLTAVKGDWFAVQTESLGAKEPDRTIIQRIIAWVVVKEIDKEGNEDPHSYRVEGITSSGYGRADEVWIDTHYVCGSDLAPDSRTWLEVYNQTPYFNNGFKDISDSVQSDKWKYTDPILCRRKQKLSAQ